MSLLDELDLGSCYNHELTAAVLAPLTRLRVLRVGRRTAWTPLIADKLPLSLQRLVILAPLVEAAELLVPMWVRHAGLVVIVDTHILTTGMSRVHSTAAFFDESRRIIAQARQPCEAETRAALTSPCAAEREARSGEVESV